MRHFQGPQQLVPSICLLQLGELLHFAVCRSCSHSNSRFFFFPSTLTRPNNLLLCVFSSSLTVPSAPPQNLTLEVQNSKVSCPFPLRRKNTNNNQGAAKWAWNGSPLHGGGPPAGPEHCCLCVGLCGRGAPTPPVHPLAGGKLPCQRVLMSAAAAQM